MNCDEYLPLISGHIDDANSEIEERRLQEHLKTCAACRALLSQMEESDALLRASAATPPADLSARIMAQVRSKKQPAFSRKQRWIPIAASGLAAAALLSFVVFGSMPFWGGAGAADSAAAENAFKSSATAAPAEPAEQPANGSLSVGSVPEAAAQDYGFAPDFPMYAYADQSDITETTADTVKRNPTRYAASAPMLIVWDAEGVDVLSAFEPEDLNEYAPLRANLAPSLFARFQTVLPLLREFDRISPADGFGITVYTVPYETLMEAFDECVGLYENAIYYPAAITAPDACSVVLIDISE